MDAKIDEIKKKYLNNDILTEEEYDNLQRNNVNSGTLLLWEEEKRNALFNEIKNEINISDGSKKSASVIWKKIGLTSEYFHYWQIKELVDIFEAMNEKGLWTLPFTIGVQRYNGSNNINVVNIEEYFLNDVRSTSDKKNRRILYGMSDFSGLLPYCLYKSIISNNFSNMFPELIEKIVLLLIEGIKKGGIVCIRLAKSLLCYINDCKKSGVISQKKYELFLNNYREYNPTVGENECISREKIDTINDYFLKIDTSNENRIIKNIIMEEKKIVSYIFEIDKKCKDGLIDYAEWKKEDKKSYDLLKMNKLQGLIDFISLKKYDYFSLTKIYYFFQHENNDFLKYNNDYDDLFNKLSNGLIRKNSSKNGIQLEKKYDELIPYCFYNGYDWIFSILVWAAKSIIRSNPNKMSLEETLSQFLDSEKSIDIDKIAKNYEWYNM